MSGIPNLEGAPTTTFTVRGILLSAPQPYTEGHTLRANEAGVLNQVLIENLRNNLSSQVAEAVEAAGGPDAVDVAALQSVLDGYVTTYDFGVRSGGGGGRIADPVLREAMKIAREKVRKALKDKGHDPKDMKDDVERLSKELVDNHPQLMEAAKKIVEAQQAATADITI